MRRPAPVEVFLDNDAKRREQAQTEMELKKDKEIKQTLRMPQVNSNSEKMIFERFERDLNQCVETYGFDVTGDFSYDQTFTLAMEMGFVDEKSNLDLTHLAKLWDLIQDKKKQNKKEGNAEEGSEQQVDDAPLDQLRLDTEP